MDKTRLFEYLSKRELSEVLELLQLAFDEMDTKQRRSVFGGVFDLMPSSAVDGKKLLKEIRKFHSESIAGKYYAPFDINSRNFMHIPEETEEWFERLGDLLESSTIISEQDDHSTAVQCFGLLYDLILKMEKGEDIVFADELGSWMIPGDEKRFIKAYLKSLSLTSSVEGYAKAALPLIRRDSYSSFAGRVYTSAIRFANKDQREYLKKEVKSQNIRTKSP
ncbi:MAG: hypothetical protein ACE5JU_09600 [Candidatus Binatia bacterium]